MIDADKLKQSVANEMLKGEPNSPIYCTLECVIADIESQTTAYDVDKVVEQLKENSFVPGDRIGVSDVKIIMSEKALKIVKNGGVGNGD